jgi:hypothetical protein
LGLWQSGNLGKIRISVSNWTLFWQKTGEYLVKIGFSRLSKKGPLSVRISNRNSSFLQAVAPNFDIQLTTADLESPSCFMLFPIEFLEHSQYQSFIIQSNRDWG